MASSSSGKKKAKDTKTAAGEQQTHWGYVFRTRRRAAFAIRWLVEHYRDDVAAILDGNWPDGVPAPR